MLEKSHYIVGPIYDWCLFLLPPALSLLVGIALSDSSLSNQPVVVFGQETTAIEAGLGVLVHAHLVAVLFRSHANGTIFRLYRMRFVAVPIIVWLAMVVSPFIAVAATVVATFWDVWHSGAQTFGFGRIYDRNAGCSPTVGRRLDFWANQVLYAGPILAGVTLFDHLDVFDSFDDIEVALFESVPAFAESWQGPLAKVVVFAGTLVLFAFAVEHVRRWRSGSPSSPLKIYLVVSTGLCSIYTWGFNSWGEAFLIMNLFHAVQYLGLVWAMERKRIAELFGVSGLRFGVLWAPLAYLAVVAGYGFLAQLVVSSTGALWAITIVVSLMHFWYDGFVWSVRARQV